MRVLVRVRSTAEYRNVRPHRLLRTDLTSRGLVPAKARADKIRLFSCVYCQGIFIHKGERERDSVLKEDEEENKKNRQSLTGLEKIAIEMSIDVCEGCRRLRKRCDKDDCVLQPCLETLWRNNKLYQGNATVFLAKYFGRKRFFELLQAVTTDERPELFKSLLVEACGRTVNPVSGSIGLMKSGRWHLCEEAVINILTGGPLDLVTINSDEPCVSTSSSSGPYSTMKTKRVSEEAGIDNNRLPQLVAQSRRRRLPTLNLDLNLSLQQSFSADSPAMPLGFISTLPHCTEAPGVSRPISMDRCFGC